MAVLVEAISVIVRREAIKTRHNNGWEGFLRNVPNRTLCFDQHLARVGFINPDKARKYVQGLTSSGLIYEDNGSAGDLVVVEEKQGPALPCPWTRYFKMTHFKFRVTIVACRLSGDQKYEVSLPKNWTYCEDRNYMYLTADQAKDRLKFLRHEDGIDVYLDLKTNKVVYSPDVSPGPVNSKPEACSPDDLKFQFIVTGIFASMMNTLDVSSFAPFLAPDVAYWSEVLDIRLRGKESFLDHMKGKFNEVRESGNRVWAELAFYKSLPCALIFLDGIGDNWLSTLMLKSQGKYVTSMAMLKGPTPDQCERTGEYPV